MKELEVKAAELLALGRTEAEVSQACGKSRSWVQRVKRKIEAEKLNLIPKLLRLVPDTNTTNPDNTQQSINDTQPIPKEAQSAKKDITPTLPIASYAMSSYKADIDELYELAISQLKRILNDPESRTRDILAAAKLVIETRQNSFVWASEMRDLQNFGDRELIKVALRNIIATARTQSDVVTAMKGLIESDKISVPYIHDIKTTEEFDKKKLINDFKRDYGIDISSDEEFRKYFRFYIPNDQDLYLEQMTSKQYID